jgi:hypothetical protein
MDGSIARNVVDRSLGDYYSWVGTVDDWVRVFKRKRDEIVNARC